MISNLKYGYDFGIQICRDFRVIDELDKKKLYASNLLLITEEQIT